MELTPSLWLAVVAGFLLDAIIGDPQVRWHPIRLLGDYCQWLERMIRGLGRDLNKSAGTGYVGGLVHLILMMAGPLALWLGVYVGLNHWLSPTTSHGTWAAWLWQVVTIAALLSNRDLVQHGYRVWRQLEQQDLPQARYHLSRFVGRDTDQLDPPAVRRATIETLSESWTDALLMPVCWLIIGGVPGLLLAKIVSTLDSMIGYRNERYQQFGMWAARLDDIINWLPARLSPWLIMLIAPLLKCHPLSAWSAAWRWHGALPSPNSGWSEAAAAGALRCRLLGPIYANGKLVNETFLGDENWPEDPGQSGLRRCLFLTVGLALLAGLVATGILFFITDQHSFILAYFFD